MQEDTFESVELRRYVTLLWRWVWLVALAALLAGALAHTMARRAVPYYEASATIMIDEANKAGESEYQSLLLSERRVGSYSYLLRGKVLLREVTNQLRLSLGDAELAKLSTGITVEPIRDTQLIRLKVRHADPQIAAAVANRIPTVFEAQNRARVAARSAGTMESLLRELKQLADDIAASQALIDAERAKPEPAGATVARLELQAGQDRASYDGLLQSLRDVRLAESTGSRGVIVVEAAEVPGEPMPSKAATNALLAGLAAAMLAAGAILAIEYLDDTVKEPGDPEVAVHLPALGAVGCFPKPVPAGLSALVAAEPNSVVAESYRVLRTNLEFSLPSRSSGGTILLVTSARPGEGKTATAANLGVVLAQSRRQVLLVDCDLRRPDLHACFGRQNRRGFTFLIYSQSEDPEAVIQRTSVPGLSLLSAGRIPINPAEVLGFPETAALLERLRSLADYVIVDSPPALSVADAAVLARRVDGVLLVAEAGKTRRDMLRHLVAALHGAQVPILGVVLNKVRAGQPSYYGGAYYASDRGGSASAPRGRLAQRMLDARAAIEGAVGRAGRAFASWASLNALRWHLQSEPSGRSQGPGLPGQSER